MKEIVHTEKWNDGNKEYVIVVYSDFTTGAYQFMRTSDTPSKDLSEALTRAKKSILGHRGIAG